MSQTYVNALSGVPGCYTCDADGPRSRAHEWAEQHDCDPADLARVSERTAEDLAHFEAITRPALRYYGGKWVLAPWIIQHLPEHESYIEPFAGAASVLLQKRPSRIEVYNDLDGEVVNFFRVLRDHPGELVQALSLTPYARGELTACKEPAINPIERARRLFVLAWQGRSRNSWTAGWRFQRTTHRRSRSPADDFADVDRLHAIAARLRHVQIEKDDALAVIERFDTPRAVFYCDPPYLESTRSGRWAANAYANELTDEDHVALSEVLHRIEGMALVSGYDSPLYDELYGGWQKVTKRATTDHRGAEVKRTECLWISPRAAESGIRRPFALEGMAAG